MFHRFLRPAAAGICGLFLAAAVSAQDAKPNALTAKEAADGWLLLFDGETTFGWTPADGLKAADGALVIAGTTAKTTAALPPGKVLFEFRQTGASKAATAAVGPGQGMSKLPARTPAKDGWTAADAELTPETVGGKARLKYALGLKLSAVAPPVAGVKFLDATGGGFAHTFEVPAGVELQVRNVKYKPAGGVPLFDGKSLDGWKRYAGDAKREKSRFDVTPAGELSVKDGPGDLQTERSFADFLVQLECKTNGPALNSGLFFRCLPGQYQQGYEAQVQNAVVGGDRTKPVDFGTGAIYRRVPARKVVSDDREWFTLSVLAKGPQINTWVNGYPVVSWADDRKPAENGRNGVYTKAGPLSIQGHDPTTDLLFRNIRVTELK